MNFSIPHLIFGSLIAGLLGSLIHLVFGGKPIRLLFSVVFSWVGFWAGHAVANRYKFFFFRYGTINFGPGIVLALGLGLFGYWIAGENTKNKDD